MRTRGIDYNLIKKNLENLDTLLEKDMTSKISKSESPKWKRALKKATSHTLRQLGKRDPENSPRKVREITRGWSN